MRRRRRNSNGCSTELGAITGLEIAQIHRMMALIKLDQELYEESIYHFEQVLAQVPNISVGMELATMYTVSQLYFQIEQPLKSLEIMNRWMAMTEEPPASAHFWMANIHYLLGRLPQGG